MDLSLRSANARQWSCCATVIQMSSCVLVAEETAESRRKSCNFFRLVTAYRQHAHKGADINPVSLSKNIT